MQKKLLKTELQVLLLVLGVLGLFTAMARCCSPQVRRMPLHRAATPPVARNSYTMYITVGPQSNRTILG
jgi:hypothetical protein